MNTKRIAEAYEKIAEGYAALALAYGDIAQPVAGSSSRPAPVATIDDDLPPLTDDDAPSYEPKGVNLQDQHVDNVLGQCPTHQRNWTVKEGGVSKAGKSYEAFYKCGEKDPNTRSGYCDKKPVKAWVDAHPIQAAA